MSENFRTFAPNLAHMANDTWHWQQYGSAWRGIGIYHMILVVPSRAPLLGKLVIPDDDPMQAYVERSELGKAVIHDLFTTYNNACFSSAMELLKKVRSCMSSMVNIYRKFAPQNIVAMRAANPNVTDLDLYARSAMAGADYTPPLFDATAFAPEVLDLYDTMKRFMTIMAYQKMK